MLVSADIQDEGRSGFPCLAVPVKTSVESVDRQLFLTIRSL